MKVPLLLIAAALVLAGCLGEADIGPEGRRVGTGPANASTTILPTASEAAPTAETGSISGSVLDDEAKPVAGAQIALLGGAEHATESDAEGRFTLNEVLPGDYGIQVHLLGYAQVAKKITVRAGEVSPITILLTPMAIPEPRIERFVKDGYVEVGASLLVASVHRTSAGTDGSELRDFDYSVTNDAIAAVAALQWESTAPATAKHVHFNMHACVADDCDIANDTRGSSPLIIRNESLSDRFEGAPKTALSTYFNVQGCYRAAEPTYIEDCGTESALQLVFQQRFKVYVDAFYLVLPAADHSPLPPT